MGANKIDYDLAPFVDSTFKRYLSKYIKRRKLKDIDLKYDTLREGWTFIKIKLHKKDIENEI